MKKLTGLLLIILLIGIAQNKLVQAYEDFEELELTFEDAFDYITMNIVDKTMNFQGENESWEASLVLDETAKETGESEYLVNLTLTPKKSAITWTRFDLISDKGTYSKNEWQIFRNPIKITTESVVPAIDEKVVIVASQRQFEDKDILFLSNKNDTNMISAKEAIKIFIEKFYETFGIYPPTSYSYEISVYNGDWLISFDDNDGIGGKCVLLIDGKTGYADDIKMDE
ncbi:MAG: hypothetical protein GX237_05205 [Clostridiales bacterium]|nr:hypothetical protein [Clostridiales bacterium]